MFKDIFPRKQKMTGDRAQAIVEFAIVLPILMVLLVGILEVGRMVFIYSAVNNASREAARYASAVGLETDPDDGNTYQKYSYCKGIRSMAKRSAYFLNLLDASITISYDHGPSSGSPFDDCPVGATADTSVQVNSGSGLDRVIVTVSATYSPMVNLIPINSRPITSSSARTILGVVDLNTGQSSSGPGGSSYTPMPTSPSVPTTEAPSDTPTATGTVPSDTPTPTSSGLVITFTPLSSSTPTDTPTITLTPTVTSTPTGTLTPTLTFTPTGTSTAVPGCNQITAGSINIVNGTNFMSMTITNPHDSVTVLDVQVVWNSASGGPAGKPLALKTASLGVFFWTGSDSSGNLTITPSTTVTIPGNNTTSTLIFTFDKNYQNKNNLESITINLSTSGCEGYPIHQP